MTKHNNIYKPLTKMKMKMKIANQIKKKKLI